MSILVKKMLLNSDIPSGTIIYRSNGTTGTVSITIPKTQKYFIRLVGGGAGGLSNYAWYENGAYSGQAVSGGAGGMVYGVIKIAAGIYTATIGAAGNGNKVAAQNNNTWRYGNAGSSTTFLGVVANGGGRCSGRLYNAVPSTGGTGGSGSKGNYNDLIIVNGSNGTGSGKAYYTSNIVINNTTAPYSSYGYGGGAKCLTTWKNNTANAGGKGFLYIEAR